jgi:hypothetical protein
MSKDVVYLSTIADMESIRQALTSGHNAFPVLNTANCQIGLIPKSILFVLIEQKAFYSKVKAELSD